MSSPARELEAVFRAIEVADTARALAAALDAWRATRHPDLADLVDRLSLREDLPTSLQRAWKLVTKPPKDDDPRSAQAIARVLFERDMFQGWHARKAGHLEGYAQRLADLADVRVVLPLRETLGRANAFPSSAAEKRARPAYEKALAALERTQASLPPLDAEARTWLERIDVALPAPKHNPVGARAVDAAKFLTTTAAEALDAVFASPNDDSLKRVVGDRLLEIGDPRGELIALSFAKLDGTLSADGVKRASTLFNKHAGHWSGAVGPISTRDGMRFDKGFLSQVSLDKSTLGLKREMWDAALESPFWATVVRVNVSERCPDWWLRAFIQSPCSARLRELAFRKTRQKTVDIMLARPEGSAPGALFHLEARASNDKFHKALAAMSIEQLRVFEADAASAPSAVRDAIAKAIAKR